MNKKITFVIGGCRSGKSSFALDQANKAYAGLSGKKAKLFIATLNPRDAEMNQRVKKHREERDDTWMTIEEPVDIDKAISSYGPDAGVILVDCLTLWVTNLMFDRPDTDLHSSEPSSLIELVEIHVRKLEKSLEVCRCPVFFVSNEVGHGIVPENSLARQFRDLAGFVNQKVAQFSDTVVMTVAGIDVQIKPRPIFAESSFQ